MVSALALTGPSNFDCEGWRIALFSTAEAQAPVRIRSAFITKYLNKILNDLTRQGVIIINIEAWTDQSRELIHVWCLMSAPAVQSSVACS